MKALAWTLAAQNDLDALYDYLVETNPKAARTVVLAILKTTKKLREAPQMGRLGRRPSTRELVIAKTPFLVWYRESDAQIEVLRVIHSRMKWPPRSK